MIKEAIALLVEGQDLNRDVARGAMHDIMSGEASPVQICAFLIAMRIKGESPAELAGCAESMRAAATPVHTTRTGLIDTCGTGGDGGKTFNISTAVAFVAAGMGLNVAKHGNRSISSRCGSADVLEALGVEIMHSPDKMGRCLDETGISFLFAPALHPSTRHGMPVRRELGLRTIFNMLGPLTNPAGAQRQVIGAYSPEAARRMAFALALLKPDHVMVVHSEDGMDEISPCAPTHVYEVRSGEISEFDIDPQQMGTDAVLRSSLDGGDAAYNATLIEEVLLGQPGPRLEAVVLNGGAAAVIGGLTTSIREGVDLARRSVNSGEAYGALRRLREFSAAQTAEVQR